MTRAEAEGVARGMLVHLTMSGQMIEAMGILLGDIPAEEFTGCMECGGVGSIEYSNGHRRPCVCVTGKDKP